MGKRGKLIDTIVRDGELTRASKIREAIGMLKKATAVVVVGSSLRQSPLSDLVEKFCTGRPLAIINLQPTR